MERSASTRAAVIAAARSLFTTQGYAATSMAQIAQAAAVSTGALYHHWTTKTDVLGAVVSQLHREIATEAREATHESDPPRRRLDRAAEVFLRRCRDRDVARILLLDGPAVLGARWDELDRRWWLGPTEELVRAAGGELTTADPRLLATALLGGLSALGRRVADDAHTTHHAALEAFRALTGSLFEAPAS